MPAGGSGTQTAVTISPVFRAETPAP
jgi:hypothetical protein